jgi:hypothetical protein
MCIQCFDKPGKTTKKPRGALSVRYRFEKGLPITDEEWSEYRCKDAARCRKQNALRRLNPKGRAQQLLTSAKERARKKKIPFDLTLEWLCERLQPGTCEATGIPFDYSPPSTAATNKFAPSLDRIDNSKGYTKDNTQVVVWLYNVAKRDFSTDDILEFAIQFVSNKSKP